MSCSFLENDLCGIYNIGLGKPTTWNQLADFVFKALDIPPKIEYIQMPEELARQYQNYTCAEMDKYTKSLSLPYSYTIETAVKDYICSHLLKDERW
jgi:ADP-L-glycero-D-manno-heptose 6-epimerase